MTSETREYYLEATAGVRVKTGDLVEKGQVIGCISWQAPQTS